LDAQGFWVIIKTNNKYIMQKNQGSSAKKAQSQKKKGGMKAMPTNHRNTRRCQKQALKQMYGL